MLYKQSRHFYQLYLLLFYPANSKYSVWRAENFISQKRQVNFFFVKFSSFFCYGTSLRLNFEELMI